MSESITITAGLPVNDPWVIQNTDTNLKNLAIGKLASISGVQSDALKVQTGTLKEIVEKVELINDKLDQIIALPEVNVIDLDVSDSIMKDKLTLPQTSLMTAPLSGYVKELSALTDKLEAADVNFGDYDAYTYTFSDAGVQKVAIGSGPLIELIGTNRPISVNESAGIIKDRVFKITSDAGIFYGIVGSGSAGFAIDSGSFKGVVIPESKYEVTQWQYQNTDFASAVSFFDLLSDDTVLIENTNPVGQPSNALTMAIDPGTTNAIAVRMNFVTYYAMTPLEVIDTSINTQPIEMGTIFKDKEGVITISIGSDGRTFAAVQSEILKYFTFNPTDDQLLKWRSQYAEKQVILTQKSSEQQLFVNELVQKYIYFSDAATNVLKAFTSLHSQLTNNL
jgi:hypothetical protein